MTVIAAVYCVGAGMPLLRARRYCLITFLACWLCGTVADPACCSGFPQPWAQPGGPAPQVPLPLAPRKAQRLTLLPEKVALWEDVTGRTEGGGDAAVSGSRSGERKSYLIPAAEIPVFLVLLNMTDRVAFPDKKKDGEGVYDTTFDTFWDNLWSQKWHYDKDRFDVNQFGHPYEGATMFGLARSAGLNFWESALYSNVGSFLWEMGGETTSPSVNDIITTGNAGSLLGEALFRMASVVLEDGGDKPGLWHELLAAGLSPPTAFNRFVFGDRFKTPYPSRGAARAWSFDFGANFDTHASHPPEVPHYNADAVAAFSMAYGLPGAGGYSYRRPFDYFDFCFGTRVRPEHVIESLTVRGLLLGTDYRGGENYRGIWGLYGSYDYLAPYLYRASSTALSVGTTGQYWLGQDVALQGSLLTGFGFGAAGTDTEFLGQPGYHYGATPQGYLGLSLLLGDRAKLDVDTRVYFVSNVGSDESIGADLVLQSHAGITIPVYGRHAVGVRYTQSIRDTYYHGVPSRDFSEGTVTLVYTFLSDSRFGAVEWRHPAGSE
jgi:hypothetical protein